MMVSGGTTPYQYSWSYRAANSTTYKPIDAGGTNVGQATLMPTAGSPTITISSAKGNFTNLAGNYIRLIVTDQYNVTSSAETLVDGSCAVGSGARQGVGEQALRVRLFPNPVVDVLQLEVDGLSLPAQVRLYDIQGRAQGQWKLLPQAGESQLKADVSGLGAGLYIVEVQTTEGVVHRQRVLKQR
jgi:hypothetical protein